MASSQMADEAGLRHAIALREADRGAIGANSGGSSIPSIMPR